MQSFTRADARAINEGNDLTNDDMDFSKPLGDDFWTDISADSWDMDDLNRMLADETESVPQQDPPTESRAARREREEAEKNAAKKSKAGRQPKSSAHSAKPPKAAKDDLSVPEDDPFWKLAAKDKPQTPQEPEAEDPPKEKKRRKRGGKDKPPSPPENKPEKKERQRADRLSIVVFAVIFTLIVVAATVGGYFVTVSQKNLPNIYVDEIFVGGMTREETDAALQQNNWDEMVDTILRVRLPASVTFKLDSCLSGAKFTRSQAVDAAYSFGHSGNWYTNLYTFLLNCLAPTDVELDGRQINSAYVKDRIAKGVEKFSKATSDTGYKIDTKTEKLIMLKGAGQMKLDEAALYGVIEAALLDDQREISFDQLVGTITMPDFNKLHETLAIEPADAYFTETFEIVEEVDGCWFEVAEAEKIWKEAAPAEAIEIPMQLTFPEVTGEALRAMLYRDKLGSQTTYYTWSTANRINNINLVAEKLNGLILMPGQEFSYNETIGQRTEEAGFLPAGAYDDGEVVEEVGGGICQVSSTLYCATMFAQLETVSRTNHYFKVDYLDYGLDATVSWPKPDYKFKNSRDYPVKIAAYCNGEDKSLTIEIWGTDVDGSYVTLRHTTLCVYDTEFTNVCIGYGVSAYRTVYDAEGNFMYEVEEPYGIYNFHKEDISWPDEKWMTDAEKAALDQAYTGDVPE